MFMILKGKLPGESYYSKTFYDQNRKLVPFGQQNHFINGMTNGNLLFSTCT